MKSCRKGLCALLLVILFSAGGLFAGEEVLDVEVSLGLLGCPTHGRGAGWRGRPWHLFARMNPEIHDRLLALLQDNAHRKYWPRGYVGNSVPLSGVCSWQRTRNNKFSKIDRWRMR